MSLIIDYIGLSLLSFGIITGLFLSFKLIKLI